MFESAYSSREEFAGLIPLCSGWVVACAVSRTWGQGSLLEGPVLASGPDVALPRSCIIEVVLNSVSQTFHTKNQLIKYLPSRFCLVYKYKNDPD